MFKQLIIVTIGLTMVCCKKRGQGSGVGSSKVEISISGLLTGKTFKNGDVLPLKVTMTGKDELHGYQVRLLNVGDTVALVAKTEYVKKKVLNVNETWICNVTSETSMEFEAIAFVDGSGGKETKKVSLKCKP